MPLKRNTLSGHAGDWKIFKKYAIFFNVIKLMAIPK